MKYYIPIKFADFNNIYINKTPHCIKHGAMNKMNILEDGGGYWRCISSVNSSASTVCRTGCCEKRINILYYIYLKIKNKLITIINK